MNISVTLEDFSLEAELNASDTANKIAEALPIEGTVQRWGDEIYVAIPVKIEQAQDAREVVEVGDLGYWPPGSAFCIFFGPTPASTDERPRAASPVNVFGKVVGDVRALKDVRAGVPVKIDAAD